MYMNDNRMYSVGEIFPAFTLQGVNSENQITEVSLVEEPTSWSVVYFYPKDFTFICPTEIAGMDIITSEANVFGISGDNEFCKLAWKENNEMIGGIQHSLVADTGLSLSRELGVVNEREGVCYRATFILDENRVIQHVSSNALDTGRNANEVLRTLQALKAGGLTGCEWQPNDDFVV